MHKSHEMSLPHVVVDAIYAYKPGQPATAVGYATNPDGLQIITCNPDNVPYQPAEIRCFLVDCQQNDFAVSPDLSCCKEKHSQC